jgi:alginate O-acetyltransferase complex protein AlgI
MVFNSVQYALFLPVVVALYWRLPHRGQNWLLLVSSYVFYGAWDWRFVGLMMLSTVTDYTVGRMLAASADERRRRRIFAISLIVNLGVLGFFKYFDFFVGSAHRLMASLGIDLPEPVLEIVLPVGISFYTFHGISYTFDVFRRHIEPARDLLSFAVFVAFFPQLVAGPIGRAHLQLPQFERPRHRPRGPEVTRALELILLGLFKKVALADVVAPIANQAFAGAGTRGAVDLAVGVYAFAVQIYADFSGYTDIARGSARLLGVELPVNFRQPYLASDITEFWRRWHISLSTWLRDYLYVPLGGNRGGRARTYRNLMLTMLIGGLWHGAAWTFVAWGGLHGAMLVLHRAREGRGAATTGWRHAVAVLGTFHAVCLGWVLFRSESFSQALDVLSGIVTLRPGDVDANAVVLVAAALAAAFVIDVVQRNGMVAAIRRVHPAVRGLAYGGLATAVLAASGADTVPFIYFQF